MPLTVRELVTKWGFDVDQEPLHQMEHGVSRMKELLAGIGIAIVEAFSAAAIYEAAKATAEAGAQAQRMGLQYGLTAQAFQELQHAANMSETPVEALNTALMFLNDQLDAARNGSTQAQTTFWRLRLNPMAMRDTDQALMMISKRFQEINDPQKRVALARNVFGRGGANLIPMLAQGPDKIMALRKEAEDLNVVLGPEAVEASESLMISLRRLWAVLLGLRNVMGVHLMPTVQKVADAMLDWYKANRGLIENTLLAAAEEMVHVVESGWTWGKRLLNILAAFTASFGGLIPLIRFAGMAVAAFVGAGTLLAIGAIAQGVFNLASALGVGATAWKTFGSSALLAQAEALAVPIAIGAAIVALSLLIEDFIAMLQGRESMFAHFFDWLGGIAEKVDAIIDDIIGKISQAIDSIAGKIRDVTKSLGVGNIPGIGGMISGAIDMFTNGPSAVGGSPAPVPVAAGAGVMVAPNFYISANTAADADAIASKVRDVHRDELGNVLKQAQRATERQHQ